MKILLSVSIAAAVLLGGCAATVEKSGPVAQAGPAAAAQPAVHVPAASAKRVMLNVQLDPRHPADSGWAAFRKEWIDITSEQAGKQGLPLVVQEGEAKPTGEAGVLMVVKVNDYRHVGVGQRLMFGIMTGNAFIDAKVEFRDLSNGAVFGERIYNTSSSAGRGIFAAVTPKQIYAIADETLGEIKAGR